MTLKRARNQRLTTKGAANILGLTPDGVRYLERSGKLRAEFTQSGQRLFRLTDVERVARERRARERSDAEPRDAA